MIQREKRDSQSASHGVSQWVLGGISHKKRATEGIELEKNLKHYRTETEMQKGDSTASEDSNLRIFSEEQCLSSCATIVAIYHII